MLTFTLGTLVLVNQISLLKLRGRGRLVITHNEAGDRLAFVVYDQFDSVLRVLATHIVSNNRLHCAFINFVRFGKLVLVEDFMNLGRILRRNL